MVTQLRSKCPKCQAGFRANQSLMGKRVRCPRCQAQFELKQVQFGPDLLSAGEAVEAIETMAQGSSDTSRSPNLSPPTGNIENHSKLGRLGRFELKELLGQGAFGRVYKAYDPQLDRFVAIKVPSFGLEDQHKLKRFMAEAKAAARLRHPNIVPVFDSGSDRGQLFIASAFIEGQTLAARIAADSPNFREAARDWWGL